MERQPLLRKTHHNVRYVEQYTQDIVAAQPVPPRRFKTWVVLFRHIAPNALFPFVVSSVVVLAEAHTNQQSILDRPSEYYRLLSLMVICLLFVLYTDVLKPMYRWWYGLRYGRYTVAHITTLKQRKQRSGETFEGIWQFPVDTTAVTTPFQVSDFHAGKWVWQLAVGSEVHVLLHPTKPKVLVALGIVDDASPPLVPSSEATLLHTLLTNPGDGSQRK